MTNEEKILQMLSDMRERLTNIEQEVVKTNLKIENDITKRLDLLTDGYVLTQEKQYELERRFEHKIDALEKRVEQLEIKAS